MEHLKNDGGKERQNKRIIEIFHGVFFMMGICLFALFACFGTLLGMLCAILILFLSCFLYAISNLSKNMPYVLFLGSFFCFLLGRMTMDLLTTGSVRFNFSPEISLHMLIEIFLSLIFLQIGFRFVEIIIKKESKSTKGKIIVNTKYMSSLRNYARILFYSAVPIAVVINLEQFFFMRSDSYLGLYKNFESQIPWILRILGNMHIVSFFVYLATCPEKKKCVFPMILFSAIGVTALMAGDRGTFIIDVAVILVYIFWRQYVDSDIWISKRMIYLGICCVPFLMAFMSYFVYLREGIDIGEMSFSAQFIRFFRSAGKSVDILGYGKIFRDSFPRKGYVMGGLIDYIKYNPIVQIITETTRPEQYTKEYALTMHSYSHAISFLVFPKRYVLGQGKGSSYIAEAYQDLGYFGVCLCNFIYGSLLAQNERLKKSKPIQNALYFISLRVLFYTPRGAFILPVSDILNITTIVAGLVLWLLARGKFVLKVNRNCSRKMRDSFV